MLYFFKITHWKPQGSDEPHNQAFHQLPMPAAGARAVTPRGYAVHCNTVLKVVLKHESMALFFRWQSVPEINNSETTP